jgi:hypothetical protein
MVNVFDYGTLSGLSQWQALQSYILAFVLHFIEGLHYEQFNVFGLFKNPKPPE